MVHGARLPDAIVGVHEEIRSAVVDATRLGGGLGTAARSLNKSLLVHFMREEELVLPMFRLVPAVLRGHFLLGRFEAYMLLGKMGAELPVLQEEHRNIIEALAGFQDAAREDDVDGYGSLRQSFLNHAKAEEEIYFPAAMCIGECLCNGLAMPEVSHRENHAGDHEWSMATLQPGNQRRHTIEI